MSTYTLYNDDCLEVLKGMSDESIDSVVTDPPYGISFMGKGWDYDVPKVEIWSECLRVLKPGGHLLAFAGTRTQHRMAVAIEDAGFEIRDMIAWVYGSGFPKSRNLRGEWQGFGTALKPSLEPVTMARKPLVGSVAENVVQYGTGVLNIDKCRITSEGEDFSNLKGRPLMKINNCRTDDESLHGAAQQEALRKLQELGRWPANLIHDGSDEVMGLFPQTAQSSPFTGSGATRNVLSSSGCEYTGTGYSDSGSAARFFYVPKASRADRGEGNDHPTVKPTDLMAYLCRLVTPPGGVVLDPFLGSGSTGKAAMLEGFKFIGIEREVSYFSIAEARIEEAANRPQQTLLF